VAANPGADVTLAHDGWPDSTLAALPGGVTVESLSAPDGHGDDE
jgi:hypothetical protein